MSSFPRNSGFAVDPDQARTRIAAAQAGYWRDRHVVSMREAADLRRHVQSWADEVSDLAFELGEDNLEIEAMERRMQDLASSMDRVLGSQRVQTSTHYASGAPGSREDHMDQDTLPYPQVDQ